MTITGSETLGGEVDFAEFQDHFQPLSLKWANPFINHSRYLVGTAIFLYLLLAVMTFFPSFGSDQVMVLKDYKSFHLIFLGWTAVIILTVVWRNKIPAIFQWLWESGRLGPQNAGLKNEYGQFLQDYQKELRSKKVPLTLGICLVVLILLLAIAAGMPQYVYQLFTRSANFIFLVILFAVLFWIFLMGLVSWLFITTSRYIGELTQRFSIQIQPGHPDGCGGLKPLGDFCFSAAIPLIIGGGFLAIIPILQIIPNLQLDINWVVSFAAILLLFLVVTPLAVMVVFMPLWNIHNNMVEHKKAYEEKYTGQMIALEKEMLTNTSEQGDLQKAKAAREKREILQSLHPDKLPYPTWPFHFGSTVLAISSPAILQAVGGIIANVLSSLKN